MFLIGDELKEFLESGVATVVGTADSRGRPHVMYASGLRVGDDRCSVSFFIERARVSTTLANAATQGSIAVTAAHPVSYHSVQLKGRWKGSAEADDDDRLWVERQREAFATAIALVGDPQDGARNQWMDDIVRLDCTVEQAFNQTPGPDAGKPL